MIPDFFPQKSNEKMSDEEWINYCIKVWCCNSLNARAVSLLYRDQITADLLIRAQGVIGFLMQN